MRGDWVLSEGYIGGSDQLPDLETLNGSLSNSLECFLRPGPKGILPLAEGDLQWPAGGYKATVVLDIGAVFVLNAWWCIMHTFLKEREDVCERVTLITNLVRPLVHGACSRPMIQ